MTFVVMYFTKCTRVIVYRYKRFYRECCCRCYIQLPVSFKGFINCSQWVTPHNI